MHTLHADMHKVSRLMEYYMQQWRRGFEAVTTDQSCWRLERRRREEDSRVAHHLSIPSFDGIR